MTREQNPLPWLAERVVETGFDDLPDLSVSKAKTFLLDTFGVGVAGCNGYKLDQIIKVAQSWGHGDDDRWGRSGRSTRA